MAPLVALYPPAGGIIYLLKDRPDRGPGGRPRRRAAKSPKPVPQQDLFQFGERQRAGDENKSAKQQSKRFIEVAREAGASEDQAVFDENLKRITTKPKPQNEKD